MITVFIVDDDLLVRTAIKKLLEEMPTLKVLGEASTGEEALRTLRQIKPDIVLLDIELPDISGLDIAKRLLRHNAKFQIIILTGYQDDIFATRFLSMGIKGYLPKNSDPAQLIEAIHQVNKGQQYISPAIATHIVLKNIESKPHPLDVLSDRELEFLLLVVRGGTNKAIADKLHLSTKTLSGYRTKIFKKLKIKKDVELIHLALRYKLIPDETLE